jgi:hypothetical protein
MRLRMDRDSFFLTKKGRFGRAPSGDVKAHHTVAILGGAWAPHILEKHESYYKLVSHAYVQGLEDLKAPLGNMSAERMELRYQVREREDLNNGKMASMDILLPIKDFQKLRFLIVTSLWL